MQGFCRRTATYQDFTINRPKEPGFYEGPEQVIVAPDTNSDSDALLGGAAARTAHEGGHHLPPWWTP